MTTAKIAALSKTDGTGITGILAEQLWSQLGHGVMAVVELVVTEHTEDAEGEQGIKLVLETIEPARKGEHEDHLRELAAALYRARTVQPTLTDGLQQTVDDVIRTGRAQGVVPDADA